MESTSWRKQVRHDVMNQYGKYIMTSKQKVCQKIKSMSWRQKNKAHNDVKKYVITSQST